MNGGMISPKKEKSVIANMIEKLKVKTASPETAVMSLSGGNQQKVILAKCLLTRPKVMILDEPTRGIDVGAKYEIYKLMIEMAREGMSVIMISSELPELLGMCDRIYVMHERSISGVIEKSEFTQNRIMELATGGK